MIIVEPADKLIRRTQTSQEMEFVRGGDSGGDGDDGDDVVMVVIVVEVEEGKPSNPALDLDHDVEATP